MKLLIVDSHRETGEIFRSLKPHFEEIYTLDEGGPTLEYLRKNHMDLVIIRYLLPDINGAILAGMIKKSLQGLPVFVASEDADIQKWKEVIAVGGLFLPVPIDTSKIMQFYPRNKPEQRKQTIIEPVPPVTNKEYKVSLEEELSEEEDLTPDPDEPYEHDETVNQEITVIPLQNDQRIPKPSKKANRFKQKVRNEHYCTVISVFSPKGGVGKTTTAVNMAALLKADLDLRTVILELTRQTGHVLGHFNLNPLVDIGHWLERTEWPDKGEVEDLLLWCPSTELAVLPTRKLLDESTKKITVLPEHVTGIIETLKPLFDCIVIDGGTILDDVLYRLMGLSDHILMISKLERETLQDCHYLPAIVARKGIDQEKLIHVLNCAKKGLGIKVQDALELVGVDNSQVISFDKEIEKIPTEKEPYIIRKKLKGQYYREIRELVSKLVEHPDFEEKSNGLLDTLKFWR